MAAAAAAHGEHSSDDVQPQSTPPQPRLSGQQRPKQQQQQQHKQDQQFQRVLAEVQQLPYRELAQLCEQEPEHRAFSASFLFWLSAQEKRAAAGPDKQVKMATRCSWFQSICDAAGIAVLAAWQRPGASVSSPPTAAAANTD